MPPRLSVFRVERDNPQAPPQIIGEHIYKDGQRRVTHHTLNIIYVISPHGVTREATVTAGHEAMGISFTETDEDAEAFSVLA